jgi:hypothetical protein
VIIQVLVAMIAYLLLRLTQLAGHSSLSLQEIAQLFSVNLTSRRLIFVLLNPSTTKPPTELLHREQMSFELVFLNRTVVTQVVNVL